MKIIVSLLFSLALISCNSSNPQLSANAEDIPDGTNVYLSRLGVDNVPEPLDTVQVEQSSFVVDLKSTKHQDIQILRIDGLNGNLIFINEGVDINIDINNQNLRESKIEGGEHNRYLKDYIDLLTSYNEESNTLQNEYMQAEINRDEEKLLDARMDLEDLQSRANEETLDFMKAHPNSIVSMMALSDALNSQAVPLNQLKPIYNNFDREIKDTPLGKTLGRNIAEINDTDLGAEAPDFSGPTPEGNELSLKDAMGKVTLIDFWASWCRPCRVENPNIVSIYQDYKEKGFTIVGVSLDKPNDREAWIRAIEQDQLDWNHVSNLKHWYEPIAQKYGVKAIPAAFLIDENGVIIGKDLRGDALREKVQEALESK